MQFRQYLDIVYVQKNLKLQQDFDLKTQAETRVMADLINWQRSWFKFWAYFYVTFGFIKARLTKQYPEMPKPTPAPTLEKTSGQEEIQSS